MGVVRVDILCECDSCGKRFGIEPDLAEEISEYEGFEGIAIQALRDGVAGYTWGVRGKATVDRLPLSYHVTYQGGYFLCDICSEKCDEAPVDGNLTKEQVEQGKKPLAFETGLGYIAKCLC